ncbi:MAG: HAMP domain-containing histidine kinase, partial [Oscillospiraceae bacterium]|nr:HAMP domain-containing histidine kinase [Candidatus Equicaccousia limihippi]
LDEAQKDNFEQIGKFIPSQNEQYITAATTVYRNDIGAICGYVFASSPVKGVDEFLSSFASIFIISAIIPVLIYFIVEYIISYTTTKPLILMSEAAKSMANGDFSKRINVKRKDEIGELVDSFNQLAEALQRTEFTRRSFIANVSHELRTPMTSIGGFIDGIIDGTVRKEDSKRYLSIVSNEIKRLSRIVQSMLNLSKLEAGEQHLSPSEFDVSKIIIETVISKETSINGKHIDIIGLDNLGNHIIFADYDLIYQVIYNLVDNAVKFNIDGGFIEFSVKEIKDENIEFSVKNSGDTINVDDMPYIFERFYKGDKSRASKKDSTGLGLYITQTIIKLHNGKIYADVVDGEFTAFTVVLPKKYITGPNLL